MARVWETSKVVNGYLNELAPTLAAGPIINVATGAAWLDGHYAELASPASEAASANGLLVVRFTSASNLFELVYRDGASTPTQTAAVWELPIAQMTSSALSDLRVGPWRTPTYFAGWGALGGAGEQAPRFRKEGDRVHLDGTAARASGVLSTVFTLPVGHRPSATKRQWISGGGSAQLRLAITANGVVDVTAGADFTRVSFEGVTFPL